MNQLSLAGWLLAELSLILMIVMVGSEVPTAAHPPVPAQSTPSATPKPTKPPVKRGLSSEPLKISAPIHDDAGKAADSLVRQIKKKHVTPGLLLLFGIGTQESGPDVSRLVKQKLAPLLNHAYSPNPPIRAYYKGPSRKFSAGRVYAEVFYFNN